MKYVALLQIIVTYIKENIITKLQKLYRPPKNLRSGNKSPALFLKKRLFKKRLWKNVFSQNLHWKAWYIYTYTHIYIYIHTYISYIDKLRKLWRKSWFCIQILNETNLIDVGSTKPTWTSMWLPLFNGFFEGCEWWNVFHTTWPSFKIFGPKGRLILCHVGLCKLDENRKWTCFLCYT